MKAPIKTLALFVCSVVVAIALMYFFNWLTSGGEPSAMKTLFIFERFFVPTIAFFSFIFGFVEPKRPWRWPLIMAYVHYFSGFSIMKYWGQIPPLELIYITLLASPGIATGYLGASMAKRFGRRRT